MKYNNNNNTQNKTKSTLTQYPIQTKWENIRWWEDENGNPTDWTPEMLCLGYDPKIDYKKMIIDNKTIPIKGLTSKLSN